MDIVKRQLQVQVVVLMTKNKLTKGRRKNKNCFLLYLTIQCFRVVLGKLNMVLFLRIHVSKGMSGAFSAIMVPKEIITQLMQAGAKGRSWQVLLKILENDSVLGLYAGYSGTLLRKLPAGVLSYSSFEYLKSAVLSKTKQTNLEPIQSVVCGALAGAISASITAPLDVVKTRLDIKSKHYLKK